MTSIAANPLLKIAEVAQLCGVSDATARRWHKTGQLPPPVVSGHSVPRWRRVDILEWLGVTNGNPETRLG